MFNTWEGGGILNTPFWAKVMMRDSVQHAYILSHGSCSRDCSQLVCILFVIGRIVCHITWKMGKTIAKLLCFGLFAGAWAHHEGLRRLKPCQFQRTVYWHCECDKLRPDARFQLLVVCSSWTHRRTGRGGWGGCSPPKFWATRIFWAAREIWAKPVFKEVSMLFFEEIDIFYFNLKSEWWSQLNSHETVVA